MSVCIGKKFDKIFQNIKLANQFQRKHRGNLSIFSQVSYERFSENKKNNETIKLCLKMNSLFLLNRIC